MKGRKTTQLREREIKREWHLVDAKNQVLGRLATEIATILLGKNKSDFISHLDVGNYVVVINASKIKVTGKKFKNKIYYRHTGYLGGLKKFTFKEIFEKDPSKVIFLAVKGMLPTNKLRNRFLSRLKIYKDEHHPYRDKFEVKNE